MKKILSVIAVLTLTVMLFCTAMPVSAAGASATVTASSTKPTVGSTVTVTVKFTSDVPVGSLQASMKYDAAVLEYVSTGNGVAANGGSGVLTFSWYATAQPTAKTFSFTVTFKAKAAGSSAVSLSTAELCDWDLNDLGTPSGSVTVNVQNPQKSGNANLSTLYISSGTLSPAFSPSVTSYNIVIPNSVTVLTVSAEPADKAATVSVEGSKNMKVGKNTRVIKVTAPNGTVKAYTLNITRQEATGTPTGTTTPAPDDEAAKVTVGEETLYIAKDLKNVTLPAGYEQVALTVNDVSFPSVQDKSRSIVLLYLANEKGENGAFYVYDTATMTFSDFCFATAPTGVYAFLTPDSTVVIPEGFTQTFIQVNEKTIAAWSFSETEMAEYYLVYALSPAGTKGLYQYDTVEGTLQRYTHVAAVQSVTEDEPSVEPEQDGGFFHKIKAFFADLVDCFGTVRLILMATGSVVLIAAIVVLIVLLAKRPRNYKH